MTALDSIFRYFLMNAPSEGAGLDIPVTFPEMRATKTLESSGPLTMRALADSLRISLPAATHLVDHLVGKGVAVRTRPDFDRRVVLVELSEQSRHCLDVLFRSRVELINEILEPLNLQAREQVAQVLNEIAQAVLSKRLSAEANPQAGDRS